MKRRNKLAVMSLQSGEVNCHGNRHITILFSPVRQWQKYTSPTENSSKKSLRWCWHWWIFKATCWGLGLLQHCNSLLLADRKDVGPRGEFLNVQDLSLRPSLGAALAWKTILIEVTEYYWALPDASISQHLLKEMQRWWKVVEIDIIAIGKIVRTAFYFERFILIILIMCMYICNLAECRGCYVHLSWGQMTTVVTSIRYQ